MKSNNGVAIGDDDPTADLIISIFCFLITCSRSVLRAILRKLSFFIRLRMSSLHLVPEMLVTYGWNVNIWNVARTTTYFDVLSFRIHSGGRSLHNLVTRRQTIMDYHPPKVFYKVLWWIARVPQSENTENCLWT